MKEKHMKELELTESSNPIKRAEFLPVEWRTSLKLDGGILVLILITVFYCFFFFFFYCFKIQRFLRWIYTYHYAYRDRCYLLTQLRWRRGYTIWIVRPSVRHTLEGGGGLSCVRFSPKATKLCILKPMLIYSRHIVVVHLVFSLSEKAIYLVKIEVKT